MRHTLTTLLTAASIGALVLPVAASAKVGNGNDIKHQTRQARQHPRMANQVPHRPANTSARHYYPRHTAYGATGGQVYVQPTAGSVGYAAPGGMFTNGAYGGPFWPITAPFYMAGSLVTAPFNAAGAVVAAPVNAAGTMVAAPVNTAGAVVAAPVNAAGTVVTAPFYIAGLAPAPYSGPTIPSATGAPPYSYHYTGPIPAAVGSCEIVAGNRVCHP